VPSIAAQRASTHFIRDVVVIPLVFLFFRVIAYFFTAFPFASFPLLHLFLRIFHCILFFFFFFYIFHSITQSILFVRRLCRMAFKLPKTTLLQDILGYNLVEWGREDGLETG
jgi:hypothetical protein